MTVKTAMSRSSGIMLTLACFLIIVAEMKASFAILAPFLLSVFIAIICAPPLFLLQKKGAPKAIAIVLIVILLFGIGYWFVLFVGATSLDFTASIPSYCYSPTLFLVGAASNQVLYGPCASYNIICVKNEFAP